MGSLLLAELPAWGSAFTTALTTMCGTMTDMISAAVPIALPVGGAYLAIRTAWRASKGLTR